MRTIYFHKNKDRFRGWSFLLLIICSFQSHPLFCQPIENHFTHYTTKDGLSDGAIYGGIIQDSIGFLWIGSENGLCRFDGHSFKKYRYDQTDTNSLRENRIYSLFIDSKNRFWVTTRHWLYLFHSKSGWFEHFNINTLSSEGTFERIRTEEKDQLVLTGSPGFFKFDITQKKFSFFYYKEMVSQQGGDYQKDDDGIEWIGSQYGLIRYDSKTKKEFFIDSIHNFLHQDYPVNNIILLPNGYLLASTYEKGLLLVNRKTLAFNEFTTHDINPESPLEAVSAGNPVNNRIDCTYKLNDSIILCSCSGGLSIFNWQRETFTYFKSNKSDPTSLLEADLRIYSIFKDREGIIWLGGGNLEKYDFKDYNVKIFHGFRKVQKHKSFVGFNDLYRCRDGKFLMGSYGGMSIYDPLTGLIIDNNDKKKFYGVNYFKEDTQKNIWSIAQRSVRVFNVKNDLVENIKQYKIPRNPRGIYDMKIDHKGRILIATNGVGLAIFDPTAKIFTFFDDNSSPPSQLTSSSTTAICEDRTGCIWVGTQKGMNKIENDGRTVRQFSQNKKSNALLADCWINDIKEDKYGIIWFTTNDHGIGRINPINDSIRFFSIAQGLPTCWFDELFIDEEDNLWAVSRMGILNMNVVTLQNKLYTEKEGFLISGDLQTIHYSKYTDKLYLLTPYSILEVDPKNLTHSNKIPQTTITGFSIFDKEQPISASKEISLQYNQNFIDIQFACLLFHSNSQIKYAYKMEGIDPDWVYCNYDRDASYTNLPPGQYVFNVKAQSAEGEWNNAPTQLSIVIEPPFWKTWWFYLLESIAIIALLYWIVKLYTTRKLTKQKMEFENLRAVSNERIRIAFDMHDDLGAGLTSIRLLSEVANLKTGREDPAKMEIEKIVKSAENLSQNLREIIWTMKTQFDKLEDFIIYIRAYAVEFFDNSSIKFQFNNSVIIPEIKMSGELRRNLFLCIKEALNNIVKHSRATEAELSLDVVNKILFIEIKDNGIGIDTNQVNKFGNGLNSMKERLIKCGSNLKIEVDNGTTLKFEVNV